MIAIYVSDVTLIAESNVRTWTTGIDQRHCRRVHEDVSCVPKFSCDRIIRIILD